MPSYLSETMQENDTICLLANVRPEALPFFNAHGCMIQQRQGRDAVDAVVFPVGSRQEKRSRTRTRCSNIILPDGTCITAMDCSSKHILLVIDLSLGHATHLTC